MTRPTPFHSRTSALNQGQRWDDWEGFLTPRMYCLDHLFEYNAIRLGCGMLDVSPLHKYDVRGPDAQGGQSHARTRSAPESSAPQLPRFGRVARTR